MNTLEPQRKPFIAETTEQYFKPYVKKLNELLDKYPVTNGTFWQKYRASPRSVPDLRNRLMKHMDASDMPTYIGIGRWCRHTPFMGKTEAAAEVKEAQQKLWAKGWYCHDHRPWLRCTSCGWKYSCAICANPHTCPHCKQGFRCNWEGCDARSNRGPDGSAPRHTYHIAETVNGEGWQQNGRRITPRVQLMMNRLHQPPVYRRFFPKSVSDIPRDGIISVRPISIRQDKRLNPIRGGWGDAPGYPVKEANYYDERVGAEGIKFVEEWEGPRGVPSGQAGKALVEEVTEDEGTSGKGKKRKREAEKRLLGDVTSALRAARRVRR
ncbi:hypothetical protein Daesc_006225 [Daldinia eschscholtzii]|uniref:Uncharacterized protein n=1 Tax=Daldinia eschscholtzii TaxID=292717 RepID=A0AAX6MHR2_9PEZI